MLAILLLSSLGIGAALAAGAIILTWLQHAAEWQALGRQMNSGVAAPGTAGTWGRRNCAAPAEFRAAGRLVQPAAGLCAAA